jgi:Tfp pilus assembly protein PilF
MKALISFKTWEMLFFFCALFVTFSIQAQTSPVNIANIRQQMATIRQNTNWSDPAAAKKATEQIQKLATQLSGNVTSTNSSFIGNVNQSKTSLTFITKDAATKENILKIANFFYQRSYKQLDVFAKNTFDEDLKTAKQNKYNFQAIRILTSKGAELITFGNDHFVACVYLATAVIHSPTDTLAVNNFGAYLRQIDSTATALNVLLYANSLYSKSAIILTQIAHSYFELSDLKNAENYYKAALKCNSDFGQAHSSLCTLYIKEGRMNDAATELFAGVKYMGCSYDEASGNLSSLQQQSGSSGSSIFDNFSPSDLAPLTSESDLVPLVNQDPNRIDMPNFPNCNKVVDWVDGGGYIAAITAMNNFTGKFSAFGAEFKSVHNIMPNIPQNAIIRDYPNERLALDCITEFFFQQNQNEEKDYRKKIEDIRKQAFAYSETYINQLEKNNKDFSGCFQGCIGGSSSCMAECQREFCAIMCPVANDYNQKLQSLFAASRMEFDNTLNRRIQLLDDLFTFTYPWFSKIKSAYWSALYAYEIRRVALGVIGSCYASYTEASFPGIAHTACGTDCSIYSNPITDKPKDVNSKTPKGNSCNSKTLKVGLAMCNLKLDCESIEFGCTEGYSGSIKRNFVKKTTTIFAGVGASKNIGFASFEAKAGIQVTVSDNGQVQDAGLKASVSGGVTTGPFKEGYEYSTTTTVMTGLNSNLTSYLGVKPM